ncbi:MAG: glycosyl hydrolase family protein [Spirochaetaceae bacterium]|nr:MAG: glycosyl hydrolase family protein [Spirochaetaceae bacterium]
MADSIRFPDGFLFGTATASLQIEGGDKNNSWYRWCESGRIKDGSHCIRACDHWNRVEQDIALMRELNQQTYRMSLEWSRIEPSRGIFDDAVLSRYRSEIEKIIAAGIVPLVTLHHFSNPLWFEDSGGWTVPDAAQDFLRYTRRVVEALGDIVSDWVTINEPSVYLIQGYVFGDWPPGETSIPKVLRGARIMARAHILAYRAIHEIRSRSGFTDTMVGLAHHLRIYDSAGGVLSRWVAKLYYHLTQNMFVEATTTGRFVFPLSGEELPEREQYLPDHGYFSDFLGVNYYTRDMIRFVFSPRLMFGRREVTAGAPVNDLGWEVYPEGLSRIVRMYAARYKLPIYITENGTCDRADTFRTEYITDHLAELHTLIAEGFDIRRYYHWSLLDNFEWVEGESARFGLVAVDFTTQNRTVRESGRLYARIAATRTVER